MKRFDWEPRYTTIAIYAFLVIAASILFGMFAVNYEKVWGLVKTIFAYLVPFVYGFGIAFLLNPLMAFFERRLPGQKLSGRMRRNLALLLAYLLSLFVAVIFFLVVIPTLAESVTAIAKNIAFYSTQVDTIVSELTAMIPEELFSEEVGKAIDQFVQGITSFVVTTMLQAVSLTTRVTSGVIDLIMGAIISLYMLANKETLFAQCKQILYALFPERMVCRLIDIAHDSNEKFSGFIIGKIIDSLIIGILCGIGMWIFKMPFITLVSLIVGVTNIIPYFGPFIGAIPGILLVLIGGGPAQALGFALFVLVLQQFDGNILGPAILGQSTGLSAMWVIFAILLFGGLYGFVGMIIGVPLLAVLFGLAREFFSWRLEKKGLSTQVSDYASARHQLLTDRKKKK